MSHDRQQASHRSALRCWMVILIISLTTAAFVYVLMTQPVRAIERADAVQVVTQVTIM